MKIQEGEKVDVYEIGISIPSSSWDGRVVSVYPKAINVLHPKGFFISLVKDTSQMSSLSILVPQYFKKNGQKGRDGFERIRPGDKVMFSGGKLIIGGYSFEFENGKLWDGSLPLDRIERFSFQKVSIFRRALLLTRRREGFIGILRSGESNAFIERCHHILGNIQISNFKNNEMILSGLSPFVGLGIGFTPSGDDFLTGVLLGEKILFLLSTSNPKKVEEETGNHGFLRIDRREILNSLGKTNYAGRTLLGLALRGQFPYYLLELVKRIGRASNFIEAARGIDEVMGHGETSGMDSSVGLLWFLETFLKMGIPRSLDRNAIRKGDDSEEISC